VKGATVWFHGPHGPALVLDAVSLAAPSGQVTATVGGDGAGKTTLLRVLAGRVIPASGDVSAPDGRQIGFMPSNSGSWRDLTVDENIEFVGRAYGMTRAATAARRDELLGRAGLLDAAGRLAGRLSGGMRQKLGFCLAMLHEPDLLILDEPSTGVDPVSRVELWRMIAETASSGRAVIMSTTYLDEAERVASVLVLDAGRVLYSGDPAGIAAAVPGSVVRRVAAPDAAARASTWRRGREFHSWTPGVPDAGPAIVPDLEDAVIALTLARGGAGSGEDSHV
jgi:ABC-2 type transport system ATP-binding protein